MSRSIKAAILASGKLVASFSGLLCYAALSRLLSEEDYGTYRQVLLVFMASAPALILGMSQALYYFLPREPDRGRTLVAENLLPLFATGGLFFLFLAAGGNHLLARAFDNRDLATCLLIFAPYGLCVLPLSSFESGLVVRGRVMAVSVFSVLSRLLFMGTVVGAAWTWRSPEAAVAGVVLSSALALPAGLWLLFRAVPEGSIRPSWRGVRTQLAYALPLGLAGMVGGISQQIDKAVVSAMTDPVTFAVFANGATELMFIGILTGSVTAVLLPDATRALQHGDRAEALRLWTSAARKTALLVLPVFAVLLVLAEPFIEVVYSETYTESVVPFRIYLFLLPLRIIVFSALLVAGNRTRWVMYGAVVWFLLNLPLSVAGVHWFGPNGAAVATLGVLYLWLVPFYLVGVRQVVPVSWGALLPWGHFLKISALCAVPALPLWFARPWLPDSAFLALPLGLALYGLLLLPLYWGTGLVQPAAILEHIRTRGGGT